MKDKFMISLIFSLFFIMLSAVPIFAYETTYTYDKLSRLTSATYKDGTGSTKLTYQYDAVGNRLSKIIKVSIIGDISGDSVITLADAIMSLQIVTGIAPNQTVSLNLEVNGDGKIGLPEVIYILQKTAGVR